MVQSKSQSTISTGLVIFIIYDFACMCVMRQLWLNSFVIHRSEGWWFFCRLHVENILGQDTELKNDPDEPEETLKRC